MTGSEFQITSVRGSSMVLVSHCFLDESKATTAVTYSIRVPSIYWTGLSVCSHQSCQEKVLDMVDNMKIRVSVARLVPLTCSAGKYT